MTMAVTVHSAAVAVSVTVFLEAAVAMVMLQ
jgi:hypothetical protein